MARRVPQAVAAEDISVSSAMGPITLIVKDFQSMGAE